MSSTRGATGSGRRERERADGDSVKVCVRIRPLNGKERGDQTKSCVRIASSIDGLTSNTNNNASEGETPPPQQLVVGKDRAFTFDTILGITSSQEDTYRQCVSPLVESFFEGYNATILAYGQTGTGKTHTMSGAGFDAKGNEKNTEMQGIIPRVIKAIFAKMEANDPISEFTLRVEYIEIYNEELRDLLHPETTSKQLTIREDFDGTIVIAGAKAEIAKSKDAVFRYLVVGGASRATGSTLMNEQSSRSHAIFTLILHQRDRVTGACRKSKFHLVDLAGSERAKRTGAVAGRFKESISINQGLLALGNVISALSDDKKRGPGATNGAVHVPYRDSKLTRLLQDSLGGNSRTLMIACVSPATINFEETLNTLKYASRAKNIKNTPIVNQEVEQLESKQKNDEEIQRMKDEIANLQTQLQQTRTQPRAATPSVQSSILKQPEPQSPPVNQDELKRVSQELVVAKRCVAQFGDAVETMRGYALEAITSLIAMERDVKALGRPVQQRLNEIVKLLNSTIQTANSSVAISKVMEASSERPEDSGVDVGSAMEDEVRRLRRELKDARTDLARDEQIFEMKNTDIQRLQTVLGEAKARNEKLIERVQQLERGGQLWSNAGVGLGTSMPDPKLLPSLEVEELDEDNENESIHSDEQSVSSAPVPTKSTTSSRGLFTRRTGTAAYSIEDDNVLIGRAEDDISPESVTSSRRLKVSMQENVLGGSSAFVDTRGSTSRSFATTATSDIVSKLERSISALQAKVEELQAQNSELLDAREESTRRWQVDRQKYEMQISEAELTIESLRKAKQSLEDSIIGERQPATEVNDSKVNLAASRPSTAPVNPQTVLDMSAMFEDCVQQLLRYHEARRQVLSIIKEKKEAEFNKHEATRRVNALEMQKIRQSISVRESISDLSKSLRVLDDKMQKENRTLEEIERLTKLKQRAERKLNNLRHQDEQKAFLDEEKQQELADLEELIVDLDSHIAFQDAELATARKELSSIKQRTQTQAQDESPLDALASSIASQFGPRNLDMACSVIARCLEEIVRLRMQERTLQHEVKELSVVIEERDASLNQLESGLSVARHEFERRLESQQQASAEELEALKEELARVTSEQQQKREIQRDANIDEQSAVQLQQLEANCQKKDAYVADLEKHLVFYKSKAKQMQAQLQQLIRDSNRQEDELESSAEVSSLRQRLRQLEDANDALTKDLAAAKIYLRSSQSREGAKVVRISRSELRELPAPPQPPAHVADA